jgi:hypothetical protein
LRAHLGEISMRRSMKLRLHNLWFLRSPNAALKTDVHYRQAFFRYRRPMILVDYNSLLLALSFCSAGLALTFLVSWFVSQADRVLMTWGIGAAFTVVNILAHSEFVNHFSAATGVIGFAALLVSFVFFLSAAHQFRTGVLPLGKSSQRRRSRSWLRRCFRATMAFAISPSILRQC